MTVTVTPESAGWRFSGLHVVDLPPGGRHEFDTGQNEVLVLPLYGGCGVAYDDGGFALQGRSTVFGAPSDFAYLPTGTHARIETLTGGRFALPSARARRRLTARYGPADEVPVELRGTGQASREVHNLCTPETFDADRLMVVEVLTPAGNWSSYPPHKHDEHSDVERPLEEIYYYEIDHDGLGYQRVYSSGEDREIDVLTEVRSGDVVLIPHGYHGPSMAPPGYDMYYLNVMAGPDDERAWLFTDDPAHAWIRDTWAGQPLDPRLPFAEHRP
ncbi:MAG TPA: 5-deoxy-glucuronate isomerase [Pseudonocardiaceae bacterium]|jgi:5-deoxy-glucuronate isomerase|nr:5-deoxy-glucuronate isomerase [Pseudonocardiaceae bacterium]